MCGRMVLTRSAREIAEAFDASFEEATLELGARYNIAPTQDVLAVRRLGGSGSDLSLLYWGLVPFWAKDRSVGVRMINARAETAAEKPAFRDAMRWRRCIVPIDGFYEWLRPAKRPGEKGKPPSVPHYFRARDGAPLAIAGLYEEWTDRGTGEVLESCTLLTTEANATVKPVHHRMPVILPTSEWGRWLDPGLDTAAAVADLLVPAADDRLHVDRVSPLVNNARNDEPGCIVPAA